VCSSYIENSPNSLGEAMSVGMPCIATDTGGIPSMMRDGIEGLLFSRGNARSLAEKLRRVFNDDNLAIKLGHNARTAAMESHSPEKVLAETLRAYKDIIDNWSKRGND
jgi:Glycosyltransferase